MIPDAEGLVREWLAEQASVVAITHGRHYLNMPEKDRPTLPCVILVRVGGSPSDQIDYPWMSFSCWGKDKATASKLAYALANVLDLATYAKPLTLTSGAIQAVYDVISPVQIRGVEWAKAYRVQATFMTHAA